jgi:hypothetical protein
MIIYDYYPPLLPYRKANLTWAHLKKAPQADICMHYGDLSYAVGWLGKWELYMNQIEELTARLGGVRALVTC